MKRHDTSGNEIFKGGKHKIKFNENVECYTVENWKKYNTVFQGVESLTLPDYEPDSRQKSHFK